MEIVRNANLDKYKKVLVNNPPKISSVFLLTKACQRKLMKISAPSDDLSNMYYEPSEVFCTLFIIVMITHYFVDYLKNN